MDFIIDENDIDLNEETNNIITNNNININNQQDLWKNLLNELGLNPSIDYPIKIIFNGIIEMHIIRSSNNSNKFTRNLKFRDDQISKSVEKTIFNQFTYSPYSSGQLYRQVVRMYRHYRYNKIINIVDRKEDHKDVVGFNYDNPRWNNNDVEKLF
jgi:hypothetical protein